MGALALKITYTVKQLQQPKRRGSANKKR
jgi:hypothetical protein